MTPMAGTHAAESKRRTLILFILILHLTRSLMSAPPKRGICVASTVPYTALESSRESVFTGRVKGNKTPYKPGCLGREAP